MYRNLRTWDKAVQNKESRDGTKDEPVPKLRERELRLSSRKRNRLKEERLFSPQ
jgi:hypothetical protein